MAETSAPERLCLQTSNLTRRTTKTNTLILTGAELHAAENEDLLDKLIKGLSDNIPMSETMTVSKLRSMKKTVLVFTNLDTSERVHDILTACGLQVAYSLWDNTTPLDAPKAGNSSTVESMLFNGTVGGDSVSLDDAEDVGKWSNNVYLQLPEPGTTILQSPPGSPYPEYVPELPEDAPDKISISDPQSISHLLYQTSLDNSLEKVAPGDDSIQLGRHNVLALDKEEIKTLFPGK